MPGSFLHRPLLWRVCFGLLLTGAARAQETAGGESPWTSRFDWERIPVEEIPVSESTKRLREVLSQIPGCQRVEIRRRGLEAPMLLAEINRWQIVLSMDTGATSIALDGWKAMRMGLTTGPSDKGSLRAKVAVGGLELGPADMAFLPPWTKPAGAYRTSLLGWPTLREAGAILDLKQLELWICPSDSRAPGRALASDAWARNFRVMGLISHSGVERRPFVRVRVNGVEGFMLLDTGAQTTCIARQACRLLGISIRESEARKTFNYAGDPRPEWPGQVRSIEFGGWRFPAQAVPIFPMTSGITATEEAKMGAGPYLGLLGNDVLVACEAVIDCENDRLFLRRNRP